MHLAFIPNVLSSFYAERGIRISPQNEVSNRFPRLACGQNLNSIRIICAYRILSMNRVRSVVAVDKETDLFPVG